MRKPLLLSLVLLLVSAAPAPAAPPAPFGHPCVPQNGVRFCPTTIDAQRVPSFDGVPLDIDVTLPPEGDGPWPVVVILHGYGGNKRTYESDTPEGDGNITYHWNNNWFARKGYAVVNASARGFGRSCGQPDSRNDPGCLKGWIHLADQRYEARDVQHYVGLLVDQGIVRPDGIGATGISYGGGQSFELAKLRDRIRLPDGSFQPWRSPSGTPLRIAAAYPRWLWSDLVYSLLPNGRFLDFGPVRATQSREPIGVAIQSYITGLFGLGAASGYYSPPGLDPGADLTTWYARVNAGEPYGEDARRITDEIYTFHSGISIPGAPAPLLLQDGWDDDLFPAGEALRVYRTEPGPVALQFGDLGHSRGQNKVNSNHFFNDQGSAFLDQYLKGTTSANAPGPRSVTAFTQTCPPTAPAGGPFTATSWNALHPGRIRFASSRAQTLTSPGGNPNTARTIDPIAGEGACARVNDETAPGTATYRLPPSTGWTLMGRPTIAAEIATVGPFGQIDGRLWDVAPDGSQTLVSRGVYRLTPDQTGLVVFQLNGNGYRFESGHVPKLELLGQDSPYLRTSNGAFSVTVRRLGLELPTLERAPRL
jgi:fermentation-respiration switch protein FrsA (DUF1100 family)